MSFSTTSPVNTRGVSVSEPWAAGVTAGRGRGLETSASVGATGGFITSGLPDQSGIMAAPAPIATQTGPEESAPTPAAAGLPNVAPPVVSPPAKKIGRSPAMGPLILPESRGKR